MNTAKKAIVIGTGAGGLMSAAYLAKYGFEVVALEKASSIGGYLKSFSRKGYHFDPGIHYIGECNRGQTGHRILSGLGLDADDLFCELDPECIDIYRFPDFEIKLCKGIDAYRDRLAEQFPNEMVGIDRFVDSINKVREVRSMVNTFVYSSPALSDLPAMAKIPLYLPFITRTGRNDYATFLQSITSNVKLQAVLSGILGCIGVPPSQASSLLALLVFLHFVAGGFFPKGGGSSLRDAIVRVAERNGAVFRTRADVSKISLKDGRATGVVLSDGEEIEADVVVACVDPVITFGSLIEHSNLPAGLNKKVINIKPSVGGYYIFLGMKRDLSRHGLGPFNIWDFPTYDMEELYRDALMGNLVDPKGIFISPNSLKDTSGKLAPEGSSVLEFVTMVPYEPFSKWEELPSNKRGPEYEDFKNRYGELVLDRVKQNYPDLIGDIEVQIFATPLTNEYWVNAVKGSIYGPAMSKGQTLWSRFNTRTPFKNLYLAGSGVLGAGVVSCLLSGVVAADMIKKHLGKGMRPGGAADV
jgi:all-trans-retinol 13,14-reductase